MSQRETEAPSEVQPTAEPLISGTGPDANPQMPKEIGGPKGPEPTRYGDWEKNGHCIDF